MKFQFPDYELQVRYLLGRKTFIEQFKRRIKSVTKIRCFEDLDVWKSALECADIIYDLTSDGEFSRDYALKDQIRRSGISVFSNIAEGFERDGNREFANFLSIAKGSCGEARAQTIFAHKRNYIRYEQFTHLTGKLIETNQQISGFRAFLLRTDFKGRKFY